MLFDELVDLTHKPERFAQGNDNLLVVVTVLSCEPATLSILEPFLAHLVAADVKVPYIF